MKAFEKAQELIDMFQNKITEYPAEMYEDDIEFQTAKKCALLCVEEILKNEHDITGNPFPDNNISYWSDVKIYIEEAK